MIVWHAALFAIILSFDSLLFKKNGAISGPVAPINIELIPLIPPTKVKESLLVSFFSFFKNKYHRINTPINGFKNSTFISFADVTL